MKYLNEAGVTKLWEKIKSNFATKTDFNNLNDELFTLDNQVVQFGWKVEAVQGTATYNYEAIGSLENLSTSEQSNLVGAINEVYDDISNQGIEIQNLGIDLTREDNLIRGNIGTLSNLTTTEKSNLVGAINEVNAKGNDTIRLNITSEFSVPKSAFTPIKYTQKNILAGEDFVSVSSDGTIAITKPGSYFLMPSTAFNTNTTGGRYHDIYDTRYGMANGACSGVGISGLRTCFASVCNLVITEEMIANGTNTFTHRAYQTSSASLGLAVSGTFLTIMKLLDVPSNE